MPAALRNPAASSFRPESSAASAASSHFATVSSVVTMLFVYTKTFLKLYFVGFFCRNCWCRRGIKSAGSGPTIWFFIHYNLVRSDMAIEGRTLAQAAGITIHGPDRWRTITGSAALAVGAAP